MLAFFAFFFIQSQSLKESAAYWPRLICVVGAVLSAANAALSGMKWAREMDAAAVFPLSAAQIINSLILLGVAVVWLFCIPRVGYLVSSTLATGALVLVFEPVKDRKHIIRDVVITLIFSVLIYALFALLGVHFPSGLLI